MSDNDTGFYAEFLDDYYAECDEHLMAVRRALLALESTVERAAPDPEVLGGLLRSLHTMKGLSGMVGVTDAEHLAHRMEDFLRALQRQKRTLSAEAVDALMAGTKALEGVVAAHRAQQPPPDISRPMEQLAALSRDASAAAPAAVIVETPAPALDEETRSRLEEALRAGARAWHFDFIPSPDLAERGISVDTIRRRLQEIGELVDAAPAVTDEGKIKFTFLVASHQDETAFADWQADGVTWTPYEAPPPEPALPAVGDGAAAPPAGLPPSIVPPSVVRVDLARLDELMENVGELVITRARLEDSLKDLETLVPAGHRRALQEIHQALERQLRDLREGVMRVRMVPIGEVFERMRFVVRDLARESNKRVALELAGQETEIDKLVVERIMDPLLHLVRNAVSHALEGESERQAQGKPPEGKIALRAATVGDTVLIEVEDDGRGIDSRQIAARAQTMGLIDDGSELGSDELLDLLCAPGFSTRDEADRASGRGVGMAVVKEAVEGLGGSLTLDTEPGRGTRFSIQLPLTLAIVDALIVAVGGQTFAVPVPLVREVFEVTPAMVTAMAQDEMLSYRGNVLPLVRLAQLFGLKEQFGRAFYALVVGNAPKLTAIVVDRILGQREIVVRAIADPLVQTPGIAGATELGDGRPILILDVAALIRAQREA